MTEEKKRVLKRSKTGLELEYQLIDNKGKIASVSDKIIKGMQKKDPNVYVMKEVGKSMIEFGAYPDVDTHNPILDIIKSIDVCLEVCKENDISLFPFATYPGKFKPVMSRSKTYTIKKKIFGEERMLHSMKATGFHHHYTLPKSVFDHNAKMIRIMKKSKLTRTMVSSYNFEIAVDPILTLFTQSSPFYEGNYLGKDSRIIVYRGGKKLKFMEGTYSRMQQIGGLPPYKHTATDLIASLKRRWLRWRNEVKKVDPKVDFDSLYPNKLDIGWHPVKLNKHGTLEQRGMDTNFVSVAASVTVLLKYCLRYIQRDFIEVLPADFGFDEAFKVEGNIMYVPPHSYVRNNLQKWSAYKGFDNKRLYEYSKRFFNLAKSLTPDLYKDAIKPIADMIDSKKTISDRIIQYAKYKGYLDNNSHIKNSDAAELSLYYADKFKKNLEETKKVYEKISEL